MCLITSLRMKGLWLKHAFKFHWAHKPLCDRFAIDVLKIGPVHLCRSCVSAYGGIASGVLLALLAPLPDGALPTLFLAVLAGVLTLSAPPLYKRLPRVVRDLLRFTSGALIPLSLYICIRSSVWVGAIGLAALFAFWLVYFRVRKERQLKACDGCAELGEKSICSGFAMQAAQVRKYEEEATNLLIGTGYVPECVATPGKRPASGRWIKGRS